MRVRVPSLLTTLYLLYFIDSEMPVSLHPTFLTFIINIIFQLAGSLFSFSVAYKQCGLPCKRFLELLKYGSWHSVNRNYSYLSRCLTEFFWVCFASGK